MALCKSWSLVEQPGASATRRTGPLGGELGRRPAARPPPLPERGSLVVGLKEGPLGRDPWRWPEAPTPPSPAVTGCSQGQVPGIRGLVLALFLLFEVCHLGPSLFTFWPWPQRDTREPPP